MCSLILANTIGHCFFKLLFGKVTTYTVASDFMNKLKVSCLLFLSFVYCLSPHYVKTSK